MGPLRASDRLRAGTIAALRRGYLDGRMGTDTFEARVAIAHRAGYARTLRALRIQRAPVGPGTEVRLGDAYILIG